MEGHQQQPSAVLVVAAAESSIPSLDTDDDVIDLPLIAASPAAVGVTEEMTKSPSTTLTEYDMTVNVSNSSVPSPPNQVRITASQPVSTSTATVAAAAAAAGGGGSAAAAAAVLDNARGEVKQMIERNELEDVNSVSAIQTLFRDYETMKEKVTKLKTLLGRSAKAQRDAKVEMDVLQKKYDSLQRENTKLQHRINKLSTRPTHMDLLADFETNFDRALLSASGKQQQQQQQQQSGGQDTSGATSAVLDSPENGVGIGIVGGGSGVGGFNISSGSSSRTGNNAVMENMLMQELTDSKQRIETLEQYNATLAQRCTQMEHQQNTSKQTIAEFMQKLAHVELEKKMAVMEGEAIARQLQHNQSSLNEMQLEIELLSKQSTLQSHSAKYHHHHHHHRRDTGTAATSTSSSSESDRLLIQQLQDKVKALEEWAIASNHAKTIAFDRIRLFEQQLSTKEKQSTMNSSSNGNDTVSIITDVSDRGGSINHDALLESDTSTARNNNISINGNHERVLDTRKASLVIGAGDVGVVMFELDKELLKGINTFTQRIALRWKFDLLQGTDADITFSMLKGNCTENASQRRTADALIKDRIVKGGAGGEIDENAFSIGRSCTLVWANKHSWIRPRTIKYILEAIVMDD